MDGIRGNPNVTIELVAGYHRLEAARALGWEEIEAIFVTGDERAMRLREIAENLHRAELTPLERGEHIAEWVRLTGEGNKGATCADIPRGRGQPQGGINAATRELGIDRTEAQRAIKIDGLPEPAKAVARETGLDRNQTALLTAARAPDPEAELRRLRAEKDAAEARKRNGATDAAVRLTAAQELCEWLLERMDRSDVPIP